MVSWGSSWGHSWTDCQVCLFRLFRFFTGLWGNFSNGYVHVLNLFTETEHWDETWNRYPQPYTVCRERRGTFWILLGITWFNHFKNNFQWHMFRISCYLMFKLRGKQTKEQRYSCVHSSIIMKNEHSIICFSINFFFLSSYFFFVAHSVQDDLLSMLMRIQLMSPSLLKAMRFCQGATVLRKLARCSWDWFMPLTCHTLPFCTTQVLQKSCKNSYWSWMLSNCPQKWTPWNWSCFPKCMSWLCHPRGDKYGIMHGPLWRNVKN